MGYRYLLGLLAAAGALALLFGFGGRSDARQAQRGPQGPATHVVLFQDDTDADQVVADLGTRLGARSTFLYRHALNGAALIIPPGLADEVAADPRVASIEPNGRVRLLDQTMPTGIDRAEADHNTTADIDGVDERVDVDIAVVDTGIDPDHPDLNVHRITNCARGGPFGGNCKDNDGDDGEGHGTHVAGTAAALDNGIGVVGMAPGARLWAVRVLDNNGGGWLSWFLGGLDWVGQHADEIDATNISLGYDPESSGIDTAIDGLIGKGVVIVAAAGNDSSDVLPAPGNHPDVVTVSAIADYDGKGGGDFEGTDCFGYNPPYAGADDTFASFSNYGSGIDIAGPGVCILSTYKKGGYAWMAGTSMASPHVAGAAALHIATSSKPTDKASVIAVRDALVEAGTPQSDPDNGFSGDTDGSAEPLVNVSSGPVDNPPTVSIATPGDGDTVSDTVAISATTTDDNGVIQVEFFVDGGSIAVDSDGSDGWSASWDTASTTEGSHTISATATDTVGQTASDSISVTVDNVDDPPTVVITDPPDGATVSGTITIAADATDDNGVTQVEFLVDGVNVGTDTTSPYSVSWDTASTTEGSHTISATATDTAGQTASDSISVTVATESVTVTVDSITYTTEGGKNSDKHLNITVALLDGLGNPVGDAWVTIDIYLEGGYLGWARDSTGADGTVTFSLKNVDRGCYTTTVTDVDAAGLTWDGVTPDNEFCK